jgi:hypothetical protein
MTGNGTHLKKHKNTFACAHTQVIKQMISSYYLTDLGASGHIQTLDSDMFLQRVVCVCVCVCVCVLILVGSSLG